MVIEKLATTVLCVATVKATATKASSIRTTLAIATVSEATVSEATLSEATAGEVVHPYDHLLKNKQERPSVGL